MESNGIDVSKFDNSFVEKSLQKRLAETECGSIEAYCAFLRHNSGEKAIFIDSLSISYSEFFRNPLTFAVLERDILPSLLLKKKNNPHREIRVWSTACAGGQETYSLAILFEELKNSGAHNFTYRIFATDQHEAQVQKAMNGKYASASLDNLSLKRANTWFVRRGDVYTVAPELKEHIDFSTFDLLNSEISCPVTSIFGDFDLVVCANLLFYYKEKYRNIILEKAAHSLAHGGYLMTGETERDIVMRAHFHGVFPHAAIFTRNLS